MIISARALRTVATVTTYDNAKFPGFSNVRVEPDGAVLATDGTILLRARDVSPHEDGEYPAAGTPKFHGNPTEPVYVSSSLIATVAKIVPKKTVIPILSCVQIGTNGDGSPFIAATDLQTPISVKLPTGADAPKYPEVAQVIPKDRPSREFHISIENLSLLLAAAKMAGTKVVAFAVPSADEFYQKKDGNGGTVPAPLGDPIAVSFKGGDYHNTLIVDGCVMPMR